MLEPFGEDLWVAEGPIVSFNGFDYPTRMAVVRLEDRALWLWSPVRIDPELERSIRALGPVSHIVSPNKLHHLFLAEWHLAFPAAKLWGTASTARKRKDLTFSGTLGAEPPADFAGQIDQFHFANSPFLDEVIFFHRASATAIIADLSQPFDEDFLRRHWPRWMVWLAIRSKMIAGWGYPPIDYRLSFRCRASARGKIKALIAKHPRAVVVAHGELVRSGGEAFLRRAFSWLI